MPPLEAHMKASNSYNFSMRKPAASDPCGENRGRAVLPTLALAREVARILRDEGGHWRVAGRGKPAAAASLLFLCRGSGPFFARGAKAKLKDFNFSNLLSPTQ